MSETAEVLVTAKCSQCALFTRHLSQTEATRFRDVHERHEGFALGVEEPPAPAPAFNPVVAVERLTAIGRDIKSYFLGTDAALRAVRSTHEAEAARIREWRGLMMADYEQTAGLTVTPLLLWQDALDAALGLLAEVKPQLTAAWAAFRATPQALTPPPASLEDVVHDKISQTEADLQACTQARDLLETACAFYVPQLEKAKRQADLFLQALLGGMRSAYGQQAADRLSWLRGEAEKLRFPQPEEAQVVSLIERLGGQVRAEVPLLKWSPSDLLAPPELT